MPRAKKQKSKSKWSQPDDYYMGAHELLGVADDYLTVACLLTVYAKDATTKRGMERVSKALSFTSNIVSLMGGKVE